MILQRHPDALPQIHEWGCYLMSLVHYAVVFAHTPTNMDTINHLFRAFEREGWVDDEATVLNPSGILHYLKTPASIVIERGTHKLPAKRRARRGEFEIGYWRLDSHSYEHFVAMTGNTVTYDPWGSWDGRSPCSRTVSEGRLISRRVFRLESA